jgi:diguanylate cyclase (GGDEF)-like protein
MGLVEAIVGSLMRGLAKNPSWPAVVIWAAANIAIASVLVLQNWPPGSFLVLSISGGLCVVGLAVRTLAGRRLPAWTLHVDPTAGVVMVAVASILPGARHVDFSTLYILVALFVAFFLRPAAAIAYGCGIGAAYAIVLAFGPAVPNPLIAWLSIFGVVAVTEAVVIGLTAQLRQLARQDPLTELANRRAWDEHLEMELVRCRRADQSFSIAVVDIDGFKAVNDRDGHAAGDRLLIGLARAWQPVIRSGGDFLARLGGDEFGVVAPQADAVGIHRLAERLGEVLPEGVEVSVGVATWDGTESAADLIRRGDAAMYLVKLRHRRAGRRAVAATNSHSPRTINPAHVHTDLEAMAS